MEPGQRKIFGLFADAGAPGLTWQGEAPISPASPRRQRSSVVEQGNHNPLVGCSNHPAATILPPFGSSTRASRRAVALGPKRPRKKNQAGVAGLDSITSAAQRPQRIIFPDIRGIRWRQNA